MIPWGSQSSCGDSVGAVGGQASGKMGNTIHCPSCRFEFELSGAMRAELEGEVRTLVATQFEGKATAMQAAAEARIREKDVELTEARTKLRVKEEELLEVQTKLTVAVSREADLLKRQRELADRQR